MSTQSIAAPFPIFCDRDGSPLDAGYIYVGAVNLPPQTNPIAVYWDADLTIPAAQPIRTSGGYAMRNGSPSRFYAAGQYSLLVTDWKGQLVYSSAQSDGVSVGASVQSFSGTGAQTNFTLAADPGVAESLIVRISGAVQTPGVDFTVSGTTLSFTEAPPAGTDNIVVQAIGEVGVSGAGSLVNASAVVYSDTTPLPTILTPQGLGGAIQVNTSTGAVSIGSNLGVVGAVTLSGGTANGVLFLDGSKVATSGSALTFDGTNLGIGTASPVERLTVVGNIRNTGNIVTGVLNANSFVRVSSSVTAGGSGFSELLFANATNISQGYLSYNHATDTLLIGTATTTKATLDASGNLGVGTASPARRFHAADLQADTGIRISGPISDNAWAGGIEFFSNNGTTVTSSITVSTNGMFFKYGGTERVRISAGGDHIVGTAALATTATAGFPWIPSCAGVPTGAPTAPYTNAAAMVVDTTNNRLYVRVGSTWRYASLI